LLNDLNIVPLARGKERKAPLGNYTVPVELKGVTLGETETGPYGVPLVNSVDTLHIQAIKVIVDRTK
jgi:hypothetical protein